MPDQSWDEKIGSLPDSQFMRMFNVEKEKEMKIPDLPWTDEVKDAVDHVSSYGETFRTDLDLCNAIETVLAELIRQTKARVSLENTLENGHLRDQGSLKEEKNMWTRKQVGGIFGMYKSSTEIFQLASSHFDAFSIIGQLETEITELKDTNKERRDYYEEEQRHILRDCETDLQKLRDTISELKHTNEVKDGRIKSLEIQRNFTHMGLDTRKYTDPEKRKGERRTEEDWRGRRREDESSAGRRHYGRNRRSK